MMPATPIIHAGREWELRDPSPATEDSLIIDVTMGIATILFVQQEATSPRERMGAPNAPVARPLTGDEQMLKDLVEKDVERPIMQDQAALQSLTEAQMRQAVAVIPANYCNLNC